MGSKYQGKELFFQLTDKNSPGDFAPNGSGGVGFSTWGLGLVQLLVNVADTKSTLSHHTEDEDHSKVLRRKTDGRRRLY